MRPTQYLIRYILYMVSSDRNFDDIAHKFANNIYGSDKGKIRQTILWQDLQTILSQLDTDDSSLRVLDAGGGLAQMSQKLAKLGHFITLVDLSAEMLKLARAEITQNDLLAQFEFTHSALQDLQQSSFDLVLCHAVMEWLAEPKQALTGLLSQVKEGGILSVMFYNHHGLVYKNVTCGNIPHVLDGMPHRKRFKLQPQRGLLPEDVYQWLTENGFHILGKTGIRCFHDYIGDQRYMGEYTPEQLLALEQQLCRQEPYISMGRYIHVWAQKQSIGTV